MTSRLVTVVRAERNPCGYCGAGKGQRCRFVLDPDTRVSRDWVHRNREARVTP